jgi:flagellar hook-associated protein 1 FlgK
VNSLTSAIAQLNLSIESSSPSSDAGTLEDQRQQDLSQLSQLIGINQVTTENNGLSITTASGQLLVSEGSSYQLTTGTVGGVTHFFVGTTDITSQLASGGGELGGYLTARDQDIPSVLSSLDQLAYGVSTQVNALNNSGTDADGNEGTGTNQAGVTGTGTTALYIFNQPTQVAGSAASMSVVMADPNQIAAAGFGDGTGDNSNATAIANLGSQSIVSGQTPTDYYSNFVTTLGSIVSGVQTENTAQNASVTQLQTQNNALSSVSLDDEASSMTTLERSYQAASQVFSMLNTIMASALNLGEESTVS